jgi:hypothetical protein
VTPKLVRAFRASRYEAGGVVIRIGERSAAMDALLRCHGARHAGLVTAWNPFSRAMPRGWNERMQRALRQAVRGRVLAEGFGRGRGWAEHHLLVEGDRRRIRMLARRFRQHAIVALAPAQPALLVAAGRQRR